MTDKYINGKEFKKWENDEKKDKSAYICLNCGGLFIFSQKYKVWCCKNCGLITDKEILIKNHTRVY